MKKFVLPLIVVIGLFFWEGIAPQSPAATARLSQAVKALAKSDAPLATQLAASAGASANLKPWALLVQGQAAERTADFPRAAKYYSAIPSSSAAALDARLGLLRVRLHSSSAPDFGQAVSDFEQAVLHAGRSELTDDVQFLKAQLAERNGDLDMATALYYSVRRGRPRQEIALQARKALSELQKRRKGGASTAGNVDEASQLLKENEPALALERIQLAKSQLTKGSSPYFEALLVEEQAQRALGKKSEANELLETVSNEGTDGTADQALMRMIKNSWNGNDSKRTLMLIQQFRSRYGESAKQDELFFIEARTFESLGQLPEAKQRYDRLSGPGHELSYRMKGIRQLAWMAVHDKKLLDAAKYFNLGRTASKEALDQTVASALQAYGTEAAGTRALNETNRTRVRTARDLLEDNLHHSFWLAWTLEQIPAAERPDSYPSPQEIKTTIINLAPKSYYATRITSAASSSAPSQPKSAAASCELNIPERLTSVLRDLNDPELRDFAQAEIDWFLAKEVTAAERAEFDAQFAGGRKIDAAGLRFFLTRADLSLRFGHPDKGVILADSLMKRPAILQPYAFDASVCEPLLDRLAFPTPYLRAFRESADAAKVPLSLVLAQARTESFFDPLARSPKDAQGLLQLLPSTARLEGLAAGDDLFDAETNIRLGAKHIARLLAKFQDSPALAASAYNAGASATERWLAARRPIDSNTWIESISYPETRDYVKKVLLAKANYERILQQLPME